MQRNKFAHSITSSTSIWNSRVIVTPRSSGDLQIDDQFEFGGLLHGQCGGLRPLEN
jgi:hypothetical protein